MPKAKTPTETTEPPTRKVRTTRTSEAIVERGLEVLGDEVDRIHALTTISPDELRRLVDCMKASLLVMKEKREAASAREMPKVPDAQLTDVMVQSLAQDFGVAPGALIAFLRSAGGGAS